MLKTHFTFRRADNGMPEHRLIYDRPSESKAYDTESESPKGGDGIDYEKPIQPPERRDLTREEWANILRNLRDGPNFKGDEKAQDLLKDEKVIQMIAAMVRVRADGRAIWLPSAAQSFAEKYLSVFLSEPEKIKELKNAATTSVQSFRNGLKSSLEAIEGARLTLQKEAGYEETVLNDYDGVLGILRTMRATDEELSARQHELIDILNVVVKTDVIDRKFVDEAIQPIIKNKELSTIVARLWHIVDEHVAATSSLPDHAEGDAISRTSHPNLFARAQHAMLDEVVQTGRLMLVGSEEGAYERESDKERKEKLRFAQGKTTAQLQALEREEKNILNSDKYVQSRTKYLEWLSGKDVGSRISASIGDDGSLDIASLMTKLQEIAKPNTLDQLALENAVGIKDGSAFSSIVANAVAEKFAMRRVQVTSRQLLDAAQAVLLHGYAEAKKGHDFLEEWMVPDLLTIWDTDKLHKHLKEIGVTKNHISSSMSHIVLRAYIDDEVAERLVGSGIGGMSIGTLIELSKAEPLDAPAFVAAVSEPAEDDDRRYVDKETFIQAVTFLVSNNFDARRDAEQIWNDLAKGNKENSRLEVKASELNTAFKRISITPIASRCMEKMRKKGVVDQSITTDVRNLTLSQLQAIGNGSKEWWEWVKRMPGYYIGNPIDDQLLSIANRRKALETYAKAIETTLSTAEQAANPVQKAREVLVSMNSAQRSAKEPSTLPNGSIDNVEQGYTLTQASLYIIDELNKANWGTLPDQAKMVAFSIAMRTEGANGIKRAKDFISLYEDSAGDAGFNYLCKAVEKGDGLLSRISDLFSAVQLNAITDKPEYKNAEKKEKERILFNALTPEQRRALFLTVYIGADKDIEADVRSFQDGKEKSGESVLDEPKNKHGLDVRPNAMNSLMAEIRDCKPGEIGSSETDKQAMRVDRWPIARASTSNHPAIRKALDVVISGPPVAKEELINAFLSQKDVSYRHSDGTMHTITSLEANAIIEKFQNVLLTKSSELQRLKEQLSGEDIRSNPVERGVRATLETVKELWEGDWVNKATVIATLLVSLHVIRKAWKEAGNKDAPGWMKLLKVGLIATPLLMVGNAAVKRQTGKDYLGEWFSYIPKEKRNSALESFRRRSADYGKDYAFIDSAPGHEALRQLTGPKSNVSVRELISWRKNIAQSGDSALGSNVYEYGAPKDLRISPIRNALPKGSTKEEAYKTAYHAFEALCVDVAEIKGLGGGNVEQKAALGADYIEQHYVEFTDYKDQPAEQERQRRRTMTMLDVIIDVSNTPDSLDAVKDDPNFIEWVAEKMGWGIEYAKLKLVQLSTQTKLRMKRTKELAPEYAAELWGMVGEGAENVYDWYRKTKPKLLNDVDKGLDASWRTFLDLCGAVGLTVRKAVPGAVDIAIDGTKAVTDYSLDTAQRLYELSREHQTIGNVVSGIDRALEAVFGANIANLVALRNNVKDDKKHVDALADAGRMERELRTTLSSAVDLPSDFSNVLARAKTTAQEELGLKRDDPPLSSYETMAVMELVKRRIYSGVVARRIEELHDLKNVDRLKEFKYPLSGDKIWKWNALGGSDSFQLGVEVEGAYGFNTLALIGIEQNLSGEFELWLQQRPEDYTRKPLEFINWLLKQTTFPDARRYLENDIGIIRKQFLRQARAAFDKIPGLTDEDKATKLRLYEFYLETMLTNVSMEIALGAPNKANADPNVPQRKTFELAEQQASDLLEYVKLYRGSSARPDSLQNVDFQQFESKAPSGSLSGILGDVGLRPLIFSADPSIAIAKPKEEKKSKAKSAPDDATPTEILAVERQIDDQVFDLSNRADQENWLRQLHRMPPTIQTKMHQRFESRAAALLQRVGSNQLAPTDAEEMYRLLRGVSEVGNTLQAIMDKILASMKPSGDALNVNLQTLRGLASVREKEITGAQLARVQDVLDRSVIRYLDYIAKELQEKHLKRNDLIADFIKNAALREQYAQKLAELYRATNTLPDSVSDTVSLLIEIVHYMGTPKGYEEYKKYLETKHGILNPPDQASYSYRTEGTWFDFTGRNTGGPKSRLDKQMKITPNSLGKRWFNERIKALELDRGMQP
jgi:hypothetical protein